MGFEEVRIRVKGQGEGEGRRKYNAMQIHLILAARNRECINPLMHTGPGAKLDSARFSWKRDISVSTEFQTTLVRVHDSLFRTFRSSERFPPRPSRETLLSERQINVDTRIHARIQRVQRVLDRCATRVLNARH